MWTSHASRLLQRLKRNERGSYIVEFAAVSLPLSILLMGSLELGYMAYARSRTEGTLREVARLATTGSRTEDFLDEYVNDRLTQIADGTVTIEKKSYREFDDFGEPEPSPRMLTAIISSMSATVGPISTRTVYMTPTAARKVSAAPKTSYTTA